MSLPPERRQAGEPDERRKKGRERHSVDGVQGKEREVGKDSLFGSHLRPEGVLHPGLVE
jgi:hypothetical protein